MKFYKKICLLSVCLVSSINAQAAISSAGWFYSAYYTTEGPSSKFLVGAFGSELACNLARNADFDGADYRIPWAGGPSCHEIHENEIELANELYGISQPYIPIIRAEKNPSKVAKFLKDVKDLEDAYNMQQYKADLRVLIESTVNQ